MAKAEKNKKLGISFGSEDLFLVEAEEAANNYKVTALLNITGDIPFSTDLLTQESGAEMVGNELKSVLKKNTIAAKHLAISLDLTIGNIIKIPYSKILSDKELTNHLTWEYQQYVDDDVSQFVFDYYKLAKAPSMRYSELLLVGTRKKVLSFFQEMSRHAGVELMRVSLDLISALNAFDINYKFHPKEKIALVEIGLHKIVITVLEGNNLIGYHYTILDEGTQSDDILSLIKLNLKTLFTDYELGTDKSDFDYVFLYRTSIQLKTLELIKASEQNWKLFNPFEQIRLDTELQDKIDYTGDNSEFVEALGLAVG
jgi:Tfp pilus assembly PilM family ATPase